MTEQHEVTRLVDAYCGSGLIALSVGAEIGVGIDIDRHLIRWARINAKLNNKEGVQFHVGDCSDVFSKVCTFNGHETCVVMDPPAKGTIMLFIVINVTLGCDTLFLEQLIKFSPRAIIYVSCDPKTQVRDLLVLKERYRAIKVQPFDMFPQSFHIENVVTMILKEEFLK